MIYADRNLAQKIERAEGRTSALFAEARARNFPESGACWIEVGGALAIFDGTESPLTQTFGLGLFDEITDAELDRIEDFFTSRGAKVFHEVSPLADLSLLELLTKRGYRPIELTSVLYLTLAEKDFSASSENEPVKTRIIGPGEERLWAETSGAAWAHEIEEIGRFMRDFGEISAQSAGSYPFLAEIENEPVATGMLHIHGEVAFLAGASTLPQFRKRGAQNALLDARLRFAREKGCTLALMGALPSSQSQRNAEKNGFRIAYTRIKWELK
jgi:GNAT superfamily N-acetyltransferase